MTLAVLWGLQDGILSVNNNSIAVTQYATPSEGAAAYVSVQMISCFVVLLAASFLSDKPAMYLLFGVGGMLVIAYLCAIFFRYKGQGGDSPKQEVKSTEDKLIDP